MNDARPAGPLALALGFALALPAAAPAAPARFAPYVDVLLYPTFPLVRDAQHVGGTYTLAFVTSEGTCTAAWGGQIPVTQGFLSADIARLRRRGGDVVTSFGGADGIELAQSCPDEASLLAQYQATVSAYGLTAVDFDVEGAALGDPVSIALRNEALAALEAANPGLTVSYTLPVLPTGLTSDGIALLANALSTGTRVDVVNIMTMDYGSPDRHMGRDAVNAANATYAQLASLYPGKSPAQLHAMLGITPMIGQNDTPGETFTLADASLVETFVVANGLARVAMWSAGRDRPCPGAQPFHLARERASGRRIMTNASPTCSGIAQRPWAFSTVFRAAD